MMTLTIGKLASACGVNIDTVRYYERKHLLAPVTRTESGYRVYSQDSVKQLRFIRKAQGLGFSLQEIKELLDLNQTPEKDCGDVREKALHKIMEIERRMEDLQTMKNALGELAAFCPGKGKPLKQCSILQHFYGEDE
ncbi:MAG: heavy metal-responsive transcriptional regulator [Alteromonadaceae bacterium]|nr:MAG: heavy metal-responsive transcriptional regulator [Alteromonadaceae bacterium]